MARRAAEEAVEPLPNEVAVEPRPSKERFEEAVAPPKKIWQYAFLPPSAVGEDGLLPDIGRPPAWKFKQLGRKSADSKELQSSEPLEEGCTVRLSVDYHPPSSFVVVQAVSPRGYILRQAPHWSSVAPIYLEQIMTTVVAVDFEAANFQPLHMRVQVARLSGSMVLDRVFARSCQMFEIHRAVVEAMGLTTLEAEHLKYTRPGCAQVLCLQNYLYSQLKNFLSCSHKGLYSRQQTLAEAVVEPRKRQRRG